MKGRLFTVIVAAAAAALAVGFASASPVASSGARATASRLVFGAVCASGTGANIDPASNSFCSKSAVDQFALETLMKIGPAGRLVPNVAEKVSQPGPLTYIYRLRKGVKFWDGTELTSADVVNAMNYERLPATKVSAGWYSSVRSITATGRYTVVVKLTRPDASWSYNVALGIASWIFEKKHQRADTAKFGTPSRLVMGTGPYKIDRFDLTRGAELSANPNYWGRRPPVKHISVKFFSDDTSMALAFRAGQIDAAFPTDPSKFTAVGAKLLTAPGSWPGWFGFNTARAPFDDIHVRRAVAYAIDRRDIVKLVGGLATVSYTVIAPNHLLSIASKAQVDALIKSLPKYEFNLTKAKEEMAASAYSNGASTYTVVYPYGDFFGPVTEYIAAQLGKIGINVEVRKLPIGDWQTEFGNTDPQKKEPFFVGDYAVTSPDPAQDLPYFAYGKPTGAYLNFPNYINPSADRLIDQGRATTDPAKRFAAYSELLKIYARDLPVMGLFALNANMALSNRFAFPTFNQWSMGTTWFMDIKPR